MFHSPLTNSTHTGLGFPGRAARRAVTWAAGYPRAARVRAAIAFLTLGTLASTSVAQTIFQGRWTPQSPAASSTTPLRVYFKSLHCQQVSDDNSWPRRDRDEPYVVTFAADLRGATAQGRVYATLVFPDVETNSFIHRNDQIWSLDGQTGSPIDSGNDYIFLAALLENDESENYRAVETRVRDTLIPKLQAYKQSGMTKATMAQALSMDMDAAIEAARKTKGDADDRVGPVWHVVFNDVTLPAARAGQPVDRTGRLDGNGSIYQLTFRLQ